MVTNNALQVIQVKGVRNKIVFRIEIYILRLLRNTCVPTCWPPVKCLAHLSAWSGPLSGKVAGKISPVFTFNPIPYIIGQWVLPLIVVFNSPTQHIVRSISTGCLWNAAKRNATFFALYLNRNDKKRMTRGEGKRNGVGGCSGREKTYKEYCKTILRNNFLDRNNHRRVVVPDDPLEIQGRVLLPSGSLLLLHLLCQHHPGALTRQHRNLNRILIHKRIQWMCVRLHARVYRTVVIVYWRN